MLRIKQNFPEIGQKLQYHFRTGNLVNLPPFSTFLSPSSVLRKNVDSPNICLYLLENIIRTATTILYTGLFLGARITYHLVLQVHTRPYRLNGAFKTKQGRVHPWYVIDKQHFSSSRLWWYTGGVLCWELYYDVQAFHFSHWLNWSISKIITTDRHLSPA